MSFKFRELRIISPTAPPASVHFRDGLNVISGPSNTGKTYIFECINYMLGKSAPPKPIPQATQYEKIYLDIEDDLQNRYTLESDLKGGAFRLYSCPIDEIENHETYRNLARKHNPKSNDTISSFFLQLNNLQGAMVRTNAAGKKREISFRDIVRFLLIDEMRIITDTSPILSGQVISKTVDENVFKYILSGNDDSTIIEGLNSNQIHQKKGKIELLEYLIAKATLEIGNSREISDYDSQIAAIDKKIELLKDEHIQLKNEFVDNDRRRKVLSLEISDPKSQEIYYDELLIRSSILKQQYDSDINRLKATKEASSLLAGHHTFTSHCPLCSAELKENCDDDDVVQIISACEQEISKIQLLERELQKSEALIIQERQTAIDTVIRLQADIDILSQHLDEDLSLRMSKCIDQLSDANNLRNSLIQSKFQQSKLNNLIEQKRYLESNHTVKSANDFDKLSTALVSDLSLVLESVLRKSNYPNLTTVSFSEDKKDFVISGENRALSGKGYRAITYASFILALQNYVADKDYSLGVPVLDSPLVTYKKPKYEITESDVIPIDLAMDFYRYAAKDNKIAQALIFENEEPPEDISDLINHERFTQSKQAGRYGFFPI